jgi:choline dehydrogenase
VLANRLSQDPAVRVLLLEAGGRDWHPFIHMPLAMRSLVDDPAVTWGYRTEREPHCHGREIAVPRGRVLGGTSSINAMIYARGHPLDFDEWRATGLEGWGYADLLPYFKRSERNWRGETPFHGGSGPLPVTPSGHPSELYELLARSAEKVGFKRSSDYNGAEPEGVARIDYTVGGGRRASSARAFLRPALRRANLSVVTHALVHRVLLEQGRATGVEFSRKGVLGKARAEREVALCGGTYNSPQLLMLSGIGPADHLGEFGLAVAVDSPEVGRNLEEHVNTQAVFDVNRPISFENEMRVDRLARSVLQWALFGTGSAASFPSQAACFLRVRLESERPDVEILVSPASAESRVWVPGILPSVGHRFSTRIALLHPRSRGHVRLRSANPADRVRIQWNLLEDPHDVETLRLGFKAVRAIFGAEPLKGLVARESFPGRDCASDAEIDDYLRRQCGVAHHAASTCRMGVDARAVVDGELRVRGVPGLRVVDCSVMPHVVGANTNAATIMIAEKAADLMRGRPAPSEAEDRLQP